MELIRRYLLLLRLKKMIKTNTSKANPRFSKLPKVPFSLAITPPPQAVIPTFTRLIPINVTTIPDTSGVMTFLAYFKILLISISTTEPAMHTPNIRGKPPANPVDIIGPINEKLVP